MKVIHQNHSQMTLRLRTWKAWILGGVLTSIGVLMVFSWPHSRVFSCQRNTNLLVTCKASITGLLWSEDTILFGKDIQGTKIKTYTRSENKSRLLLLTNEGEFYPIYTFEKYGTVKKWVEEIEIFFKDTQQQNLFIESSNRLSAFLVPGLTISVGLLIVVSFGKVVFCKIDKTLGLLTVEKYGLLGNFQAEYRIRDLRGITVQKSRKNKGTTMYRVALVMDSGEYIPFSDYYTAGFVHHQQIADRISQFLKLEPLRENDPMFSLKEDFDRFKDIAILGLMNDEKREDKLVFLQQAVMNNRNDAEANYQYGFALYVLQRYQEAKPVLEEAQRLFALSENKKKVQYIDVFLKSLNQKL
ncbi:tetratricopeptide repeat protein [Nodularia harveyana UHCC-0300]|uniref:Tetratricopeptide repeat protein n=1 Tax=Nodularia harveyana UHCC-0300 TaxID=2974287 RepID=A0ABU5UIN6_9CYAN|nr:tetratricopeptide repeat protein [Nodularia harveyana]MEA5583433.1 tetratricopeptide repeat protein [Nodularia harveyana UHCC-0300]